MMQKWLLRLVYAGLVLAPIAAGANYFATQPGSGTTFASALISGAQYVQFLLTDSGGGDVSDTANHAIKVNVVAGVTVATSVAAGSNVTEGNTTDAACAADNTSGCTIESRLIRIAQNLTTVDTDVKATGTVQGTAAVGAAPSGNPLYLGANGSGATGGQIQQLKTCDQHAKFDATTTGYVTLVAGVASRKIYICGFLLATGGTATNLDLSEDTVTNCTNAPATVTPVYQLIANDKIGANSPFWNGMATATAGNFLCIHASAGNSHQAEVWYTIQ